MPTDFDKVAGVAVDVRFVDGHSERIAVKELSFRDLQPYARAHSENDECAMVEVLCGKPPGWSDTLTRDSHETLVREGEALNADFFGRWLARGTARIVGRAKLLAELSTPPQSPTPPQVPG